MSGDDWVASIRAHFPILERFAYLNTGSTGPIPNEHADAARREAERGQETGRGNMATFGLHIETRERARRLAARLLGADFSEIALVHHSSEAVNIVLWGLDWRRGDRVVATSLEHDAVSVPLGLLRERLGIELDFAEVGNGERAVDGIERALSSGARLVTVSHVAYGTGALLPLAEIVELAHRAGALVLVDGAQAAGAMPLDLHALGVDFYTVSGQKWLCGPEGTGALYIRSDRLSEVRPTFAGYFSAGKHDHRGRVELHPDARRFELGMMNRPCVAGFEASLRLTLDEVRVERAWLRSLELAALCRRSLESLAGVRILTPVKQASQLLSFDLPAFPPAHLNSLAMRLVERGVIIRSIDHPPYALRASLGYFNTAGEVNALVDAVREALRKRPDGIALVDSARGLPTRRV